MKTWIYTSNDRSEMELVSELLNDNGIAATIGEFSDEPEFAGELAVLIDGERYEDAERIVKVFYEQRDQLRAEAKSRRTWARLGWPLFLLLAAGSLMVIKANPRLLAFWAAAVGYGAWLIRRRKPGG